MHTKRHVSADGEAHENDVFRALAAFVGYFRRKVSVICTNCTPLNTASSGSTPGLNRVRKGKNPKIYDAHAPHLHPIWPQVAPGAMRQHLFPLSIGDGEGERRARKIRGIFTKASHNNCNKCDNPA